MKLFYQCLLVVAAMVCVTTISKAQGSSFSTLIQSGPADATRLLDAYAGPLFKGIGTGLNSGWYNSAKTNKLLHFDFRFSVSSSYVPTGDKTFDVTQIGLTNNVRPDNPGETIAQTFGGSRSISGPLLDIYDDAGQKVGSFKMPSGQLGFIPAPQIQLTVGLPENTDFTIRGIPAINLGSDGNISSLGFGIRHDLIRDFVGGRVSKIIPIDLAVAFGYSHLNMNIGLNVQPGNGAQPENASQSSDFSNQHVAAAFNNVMGELIFSKKITFFTWFFAMGYNSTHTAFNVVGNYPVTNGESDGTPTYTTYPNPIGIDETSVNGLRADVGFQLTPGFFRIYFSTTLAAYKSINGGIGFGF